MDKGGPEPQEPQGQGTPGFLSVLLFAGRTPLLPSLILFAGGEQKAYQFKGGKAQCLKFYGQDAHLGMRIGINITGFFLSLFN